MDLIEAAKIAKDALEDKKAEDIKILDIKTPFYTFYAICKH